MVASIAGALSLQEERPASGTRRFLQQTSSFKSESSRDRRFSRAVSSNGNTKASTTGEAAWSEEEREGIRIRAWNDPREFSEWATTLPAGVNRQFALETAALAWGANDPSSAAIWAGDLSSKTERTRALTHIASEAVRTDPHLALELACSLPDPTMDEVVPRAATEWAAQDPAAAANWARQISDQALRGRALAGIATVWSELDPATAATMAVNELPSGRLQADTIVSIVQRWAQQDRAQATAWVETFPEGPLWQDAMDALR